MTDASIDQVAEPAILPFADSRYSRRRLGPGFIRQDVAFFSRTDRCHAWHYLPESVDDAPLVVMAHGFGAEKAFRLPALAERFARRGMAVLLFDYRHFGQSDGQPRQLICHRRQLEDWQSAVTYARTFLGTDLGRIALWGTSFGAGHALVTAARNPGLAAPVLQVPMVDVPRCMGRDLRRVAQSLYHGLRDLCQRAVGLGPYEVPIVAPPGRFAVINEAGCKAGYASLVPPGSRWQNACPASVLATAAFYRPIAVAHLVQCPTLVTVAANDQLIPPKMIDRLVARLPNSALAKYPGDHFQLYHGEAFESLAAAQADFLARQLLSEDSSPALAYGRAA